VQSAPGAHVTVDGRAWPFSVYAGDHRIVARLPDGRVSSADVALVAGQALTLTLPTGLLTPRVRELGPAAPGLQVERVWRADDAWRVGSMPVATSDTPDEDAEQVDAAAIPAAGQTVALTARGAERLATIDAYAGLAESGAD
jgi:hypothetical protein